jgi:acyl-CoA reductase-like NAD-dependent aldehyde dehydrogenase
MNDDDEVLGLVDAYVEANFASAQNPQAAQETLSKIDDLVASREQELADLRVRHSEGTCSSADFLEFRRLLEQGIKEAKRSRELFALQAARFEQKGL